MHKRLQHLLQPVAHGVWLLTPYSDRFRFTLRNHLSRQPVTSPQGPVVSVATYGPRLATAHLAMESIAAGSLRPSRLLLWLDDPAEFANLTPALKRLQARGMEVKLSDRNYGPHKKYFPYIKSRRSENLPGAAGPLVTADDDIMYPRHWLRGLVNAYREAPDLVQCYRARVVRVTEMGLAPYATWELCHSSVPSALTLAIGVSGVIYPPEFLDRLENAGAAFERICPRADDLWLHVNAVRHGFLVRQIGPKPVHFTVLPGTQEIGLQQQNLHNNGNDEQVRKTYGRADFETLRAAANASVSSERCSTWPDEGAGPAGNPHRKGRSRAGSDLRGGNRGLSSGGAKHPPDQKVHHDDEQAIAGQAGPGRPAPGVTGKQPEV